MSASVARSHSPSAASTTASRADGSQWSARSAPAARQPLELGRVRRHAHDHHRHAVPRALAQLGDPVRAGVAVVRHPRVAVLEHAVVHRRPAAAHVDRRMRRLQRLGVGPDPLEGDELAVEARLVLGPDRLHGEDALAHEPHAGPRVGAVVGHLLAVPPRSDAEVDAAAGEVVEAGDRLGGDDRVALRDEADAAADAQRRRGGERHRHGHEQVVGVRVLAGQRRRARAAAGRRPAAGGDVRVLGEHEPAVAARLDEPRELAGCDPVVGGEVGDSGVHGSGLPR